MTRTRRLLLGAGFLALAVSAVVLARRYLPEASFFQVRRVELVGLNYLSETEVLRALDLERPRPITAPMDSLAAAAQRLPGVASAQVFRRLPGTIRIELLEEEPIALATDENGLVLLDHRGRPLPFDPTRGHGSLPIADSGAFVATLLTRVMLADPLWYDEVETVRRDGNHVVFTAGPHRVRLDPAADRQTLRNIGAVRAYLSEVGTSWREIDGRFRGRVFVRKDSL